MWLVRLLIGVARPSARGRKRRRVGPSSTVIEVIRISSPIRSWLFSAFAAAESISLWMSSAAPRGENGEQRAGLLDVHAADLVGDQARLARGDADVLGAGADDRQLVRVCATATRSGRFLLRFASAFLARRRFFPDSGFAGLSSLPLASFLSALGAVSFFVRLFFGRFLFRVFRVFFRAASFSASGLAADFFAAAFFAGSRLWLCGFRLFRLSRFLFFVFLVCHQSVQVLSRGRRASGRCGSGRTRRACARPSTPR